MKRPLFLSVLILSLVSFTVQAQVTIVKNEHSTSRIIKVERNTGADSIAATILQDFVKRISGVEVDVVEGLESIGGGRIKKNDIVISSNNEAVSPDGFAVSTTGGVLRISGGRGRGAIYGVVALLERYLGVDYLAAGVCNFTPMHTVSLPELSFVENPSFEYRQVPSFGEANDPLYKLWHRVQTPDEFFAGGYWVHTFDRLMPSARYGAAHPEYYSYFRGKRNPGSASQWCLTNPDVLEIAASAIDSIFRANPDKHIISVSQNDGNLTNCQCENCKAIDDREGSPSGSLIWFINRLAERFPDKQISTLAYLYTMRPPRDIKPLPNVNIMLCSIDADREVPLTDNASGMDFVNALRRWSAISNNIFVWDYAINFDNYLSPFPNFHVLKPNMELFAENHATMQHCQMNCSKGTNFGELRSYMAAKLAWRVDADADSLMRGFLKGYYGAAAPHLYQYIKTMEGALLGSGERLWIYDSPVTFKGGMLKPCLMDSYKRIFDEAEKAVAGDEVLSARVREARLPLMYSELEILRTSSESDPAEMSALLDLFEEQTREFGVVELNERGNSPEEYCTLYRKRFMPPAVHSLAAGAAVSYLTPPTGRYAELGMTALTDELFGGSTFVESWVGWEGADGAFVIDLGEIKQFTTVSADCLHQLGQWILFPRSVGYSVSDDGVIFSAIGSYDIAEDRSPQVKHIDARVTSVAGKPFSGRYIKVDVKGVITCPEWHYGVGHPCWFFIDEVGVY